MGCFDLETTLFEDFTRNHPRTSTPVNDYLFEDISFSSGPASRIPFENNLMKTFVQEVTDETYKSSVGFGAVSKTLVHSDDNVSSRSAPAATVEYESTEKRLNIEDHGYDGHSQGNAVSFDLSPLTTTPPEVSRNIFNPVAPFLDEDKLKRKSDADLDLEASSENDQRSKKVCSLPSRYESQKRRDWNAFRLYLESNRLELDQCCGANVLEFLRYLDQSGKTKVHIPSCSFYGVPNPPNPCGCPLRQAWGSLDALTGRLRAAFEEHGGKPESNPFGAQLVRLYLRDVREVQGRARGIAYEKKRRKRSPVRSALALHGASTLNLSVCSKSAGNQQDREQLENFHVTPLHPGMPSQAFIQAEGQAQNDAMLFDMNRSKELTDVKSVDLFELC